MKDKIPDKKIERRHYLSAAGAIFGSSFLATGASAQSDNSEIDIEETVNGVLITTTRPNGLSQGNFSKARRQVFSGENPDGLLLADIETILDRVTKKIYVGYYISWDGNSPTEELWSVPSNASQEMRENREEEAKNEVLNTLQIQSVSNDPVDAGPGWDHQVTLSDDSYVVAMIDGETYVSGFIELLGRLYRAEDVSGRPQYGLSLVFTQWPGNKLDNDSSITNTPRGWNSGTVVTQHWDNGGTDVDHLEHAPTRDTSSSIELQNISFGISSIGPSAQLTLSPSDDKVAGITNTSDPNNNVQTNYDYGGDTLHRAGEGGDDIIQAGNNGVFTVNHNYESIVLAEVEGEFYTNDPIMGGYNEYSTGGTLAAFTKSSI